MDEKRQASGRDVYGSRDRRPVLDHFSFRHVIQDGGPEREIVQNRPSIATYGEEAEDDDELVVDKSTDGDRVARLFDAWFGLPQQPADHLPSRSLAHVVDRVRSSRREQLQRRKTGDLYNTTPYARRVYPTALGQNGRNVSWPPRLGIRCTAACRSDLVDGPCTTLQ